MTDFYFHHQSQATAAGDPHIWIRDDLAKGAGGDYRFLSYCKGQDATDQQHYRNNDHEACNKDKTAIKRAALWRRGSDTTTPPQGWTWISADLNEGRGGDYLYIVTR